MIPLEFEQRLGSNVVTGKAHVRLHCITKMGVAEHLQWERLSASAGADSIFACDWFVRPVLEHFDQQHAYRLFVAIDANGDWYAVMPVARANRFGRIPMKNWSNLKNANQFFGLPLVKHGYEQTFWSAFLAMLDDAPGNSFAFYAKEFPADHRITKALFAVCDTDGRSLEIVGQYQRAMLRSGESFQRYWDEAVPKKRQKRLMTLQQQLERDHGQISYRIAGDAAALDRWIEDFLALEMGGWKGRGGSAIASSPNSAALFRSVIRSAFSQDNIVCMALHIGKRPVAMSSYFIKSGQAFGFKNCYDDSYARYAPGILLVKQIMTVLDSGDPINFDSCANDGEDTLRHIWMERRQILNLCVGLNGWRARQQFSVAIALRRLWHSLKRHKA